jgi:acyl-CoA dehydrogenase
MTRYAAAFAFASDIAMLTLGGALKRREKLSARLGDVLSQLYICSATLKKFEDDSRPAEDVPLLHWALDDALFRIQTAFDGVLQNFPNRLFALVMRALIFPLGQCLRPPSDELGHQVASLLMQPGAARDRLTTGMFIPTNEADAMGALESSLASTLVCEPLQAELEKARKEGKLIARDEMLLVAEARDKGHITAEQALQLQRDYALRRQVIMVDDFAPEVLRSNPL